MRLINKIRAFLTLKPNASLGDIAKELKLPSEDIYRYMSNDIANQRIIVCREVGSFNTYKMADDIGDSLLVLDAIELLEALGYTVEQWKE